jgi:protein-S-isoprenylcysteine O-methyltransferase Ste14
MMLGIWLGYASLTGLINFMLVFLPSLGYRIKVEDTLLAGHFDGAYRQYASKTKRIFPGIW